MTRNEFIVFTKQANILHKSNGNITLGRAYMNTLNSRFPKIYKEILGTESDCSHDDSRIELFFKVIAKTIQD